jgi:hypothetical protein
VHRVLAAVLAGLAVGCAGGCTAGPQSDFDEIRERLKDPAQVFPAFQELVRAGEYGRAHALLAPGARRGLPYEAFYLAFTAFEAPRRMILTARVREAAPGRVRIGGEEFGTDRELRLVAAGEFWTLDLGESDVEYFKGRALAWFRRQVRSADGWHFAYPPDWTYAPAGRR